MKDMITPFILIAIAVGLGTIVFHLFIKTNIQTQHVIIGIVGILIVLAGICVMIMGFIDIDFFEKYIGN